MTATGIGIFEGYCEKDFTINPKSAESLSIDTIDDKVFSGVAQTPDAVIKDIDWFFAWEGFFPLRYGESI